MPMEKPAHVLPDQVVDFDFYRPGPLGADPFIAWRALHQGPPMQWTPRNGGHWIATRGDDIKAILSDWERFSSSSAFIPRVAERPRAVPLEYDPPEHEPLRKMLMPAFTPDAIQRWSNEARTLAISLIDSIKVHGHCEFISSFSQQLPIIIFLRMLDLPLEDREPLLAAVNATLRPKGEEDRVDGRAYMNAYIGRLVEDRRAHPRGDILSVALQSDIGGRGLNDAEARGLASGLLGGGLDTVAASMGWAAYFLAENPTHRRQLIDNPKLIPNAIQEILRRYSVPNIARVVRHDMEFNGAQLKAGEQVLMSACMHAMDPHSFADPLSVDFSRRDASKHSVFSHGIHRCVGSALALQEMRIFIEEWLARVPDFRLDPNDPPVFATGIVHAVERLTLRWD